MKEQTKTIRVGILGFGDRGVSLVGPILNHSKDNQITTIIDPNLPLAKHFLDEMVADGVIPADEAARVKFLPDIAELGDGELDVLFLCTYERVRTQLFEQAVRTGAHLYMEKGLSSDLEGCRTVVSAMKYKRPDQIVMMGFNARYSPLLLEAKNLIDQGWVGRVLMVHCIEMLRQVHGSSFFGRFHRDVVNSGGMFVTKSCHEFDLLNHFIGSRPTRVMATKKRSLFGLGGPDAREFCHTCDRTADCEFSKHNRLGGSRAQVRRFGHLYTDSDRVSNDGYTKDACVWKAGTELCDTATVLFEYGNGARANYAQVLYSPVGNLVFNIFGDRGSLFVDLHAGTLVFKDLWNGNTHVVTATPVADGHGGADTNVIAAFFGVIRNGGEPPARIEDGVWSICTAMAGYESAKKETWVDVPPLVESVMKG